LNRKPTIQEAKLIDLLVKKSSRAIPENWRDGMLVRTMDDGGMGSLYLLPGGCTVEHRVLKERISDLQFTDLDGVEVIASLNVDSDGHLFELDIWKTDFGKLLKFPDL